MSEKDQAQWQIGDELFESWNWEPNRANLGPQWRSVASQMLAQYWQPSVVPVPGFDKERT